MLQSGIRCHHSCQAVGSMIFCCTCLHIRRGHNQLSPPSPHPSLPTMTSPVPLTPPSPLCPITNSIAALISSYLLLSFYSFSSLVNWYMGGEGGGGLLLPYLMYNIRHPHSNRYPHVFIFSPSANCVTSIMHLIGLVLSFSVCVEPPLINR